MSVFIVNSCNTASSIVCLGIEFVEYFGLFPPTFLAPNSVASFIRILVKFPPILLEVLSPD